MATLNTSLFSQVGLKNPDPVDTIDQNPIDHNTLKHMNTKDRNRRVVGRANFFGQLSFLPYTLDAKNCSVDMRDARRKAAEGDNICNTSPTLALKMPTESLIEAYPSSEEYNQQGQKFWQERENAYQSADALDVAFREAIARFGSTMLCEKLKKLTEKLCQDQKFDKIVAFGGNTLGHKNQPPMAQGVKLFAQHAALLSIRDNWVKLNDGKSKDDFEIYLQDPLYNKNDLEVAKRHGMTIVCGDLCHQMGWVLIDDRTLVVDLDVPHEVNLPRLVFEISRPAGLLICSPPKYTAGSEELISFTVSPSPSDRVFAYTLAGKDITVPHYGLSEPIFKNWADEYELRCLDKNKLEIGVAQKSSSTIAKAEADGYNGVSYLGSSGPILLRRTT
ncbi:hypothetical protein MFRU_032g00190 [Monilinia fructicola]|nr:hypothetical protein MFRU_032g00190 [Monilinia fructicola]